MDNAKVTKIATYNINIKGLEGNYTKANINMYEFVNKNSCEYWYCVEHSGTMHFALGFEKPLNNKSILKHYIDKDLLEMDL